MIIRSLVQGGDVDNFIYSTGRNGIDNDDPLLKAFMNKQGMSGANINEAKILLREQEAERAAEILQSVPGIKGTMHVKPLRVDMVPDNKKRESMIAALEPLIKEHKERFPDLPVVVGLPHLVDEHKTHQEATKYTLEALAELARRYEVKIQLLFYLAPWSGDYNTYFHYSRSEQPTISGGHKEIQDILDPLSQGFAYNTSSLTGGHGQRSLSPQEMGGGFVERFRRTVVSPVAEQVAKMGDEDQAMAGGKVKDAAMRGRGQEQNDELIGEMRTVMGVREVAVTGNKVHVSLNENVIKSLAQKRIH